MVLLVASFAFYFYGIYLYTAASLINGVVTSKYVRDSLPWLNVSVPFPPFASKLN